MDGFTYNGIHCETYSVYYTPDPGQRWFESPEFEIYSTDVSWRHGGYYFGNKAKIRTITVPCYFEEITEATREKIRRWLGRDTYGELIFDDRPFVKYFVRPANNIPGQIYNDCGKYSGVFTIEFQAEDPFGYLMRKSNSGSEDDHAEDYCGIIDASLMPAEPTPTSRNFMVYNPGTEKVGMTIRLSGSTDNPIRFLNTINRTSCDFSSLPSNDLLLRIDGDTGYCMVGTGTLADNGSAYHDRGIVRLEPCTTETGVSFTYVNASGTAHIIQLNNLPVRSEMIGARVMFDSVSTLTGTIQTVNTVQNRITIITSGSGSIPASGTCKIQTVNNIQILEQNSNGNWVTPTTLSLSTLEVDYRPRLL